MGYQLKHSIKVSHLAELLSLPWHGSDLDITNVRSYSEANIGSLCFNQTALAGEMIHSAIIIAPPGFYQGPGAFIQATNARLAFAKALHALDREPGFISPIEPPLLGEDVVVSPSAVLGRGVKIGARTCIGNNVVISDGVHIGEDCVIKSNTVIGEPGFGFERDEVGIPIRILHLGSVVIGNRVEIGSLNTICRATLGVTVIEDDVKTDDHVHIAHNCRIRRGALIAACAELSGGVDVGERVWIGPNTSIIQKAVLGACSFIGIASNVTKSVPDAAVVAGNPAKQLR